MRIRSVTCFLRVDGPTPDAQQINAAGQLARQSARGLQSAGFPVQTVRLATQPLLHFSGDPLKRAAGLGKLCSEAGFDYLSLGPVVVDASPASLAAIDHIPQLIRETENVFAGVLISRLDQATSLEALRRMSHVVWEIAHTTHQGFGNLRTAMLAHVGPLCPFFPAAYHDGGPPALALATESADLAVEAFAGAASLADARRRLTEAVETNAERLVEQVSPLAQQRGYRFAGIDFSLAPFPEEARSIGKAIEQLGVDCFGAPGTLFAVSLLTECLRQARYPRCGFNGLMIPVLEDSILAQRSREGRFSVNDLLLYSAVCGTGLDTVPLPGDITEDELAAIFLDVAALALRLEKPLTARLMPIPGAKAGDLTNFDFPFFAASRVLAAKGCGSKALFSRSDQEGDHIGKLENG